MTCTPVYRDGWSRVIPSAYSPGWPWYEQQVDTYRPRRYLTPADRLRMANPQASNFVRTWSTHPSEPNPYFERKVIARFAARRGRPDERYYFGQDINWNTLGTRGA